MVTTAKTSGRDLYRPVCHTKNILTRAEIIIHEIDISGLSKYETGSANYEQCCTPYFVERHTYSTVWMLIATTIEISVILKKSFYIFIKISIDNFLNIFTVFI